MRTFSEYKQILDKKGWYFAFSEVKKRIFRLRWLRNINVIEAAEEDKMYRYLKKYYKYQENENISHENKYPDKIWICWLQGIENAPHLVKKCYESMQKFANGREVIVITTDNIKNYVDFPDYIWEKYNKKQISHTHLSDLLRVSLLAQYGGIWADATCLFTAPVPDYIATAPIFCFKNFLSSARARASSWFIAAQPNNEIVCQTRNMLYEYWKNKRFLKYYYLFHLCFAIVADNKNNSEVWKKVSVFPNTVPQIFAQELFDPYDNERFEQIKNFSFIHKLSYKFPQTDFAKKGTFYDVIFNAKD